ncbi:MAG: insulinase family protein [Synoicihabitans sp.]
MLKSALRPLLSALLVGVVTATALAAEIPELPPRIVATTDKAEFRRFVLDNGLRVLLVSDPNFNKSGASLAVGIGQIDDPFEHAGLAHFLEHMLFLGTEKYPDVSDYGTFINTNGGYNNAYTTTDLTNYQFEVRHEALEGALDRFAQFFIAPLFNPDFTEREVNAVNNEAMRHVQSDVRRMLNVRRELYNPAAGESKFSTGNLKTLANADADVVRAFYEANYSADRMALAIASNVSLDELEKLTREKFSAIPNRDLETIEREPIFLPRKEALRLATIEPVKEIRELWLEFVIPPTRPHFASKPDELLLSLINYPGEGGLIEALKAADLATQVGGFTWTRTTGYESLFLSADLTPHGAQNVQQVMEIFFAYLQHLRASPFPADFYADQARIASLEESYNDRGEGADLATELANNALYYPLPIAERAPLVWGEPDEAAYRNLLNALTPDNMLATFQAKGVPTDRTEEIYETSYAYTETTGEPFDRLVNPPTVEGFALPPANPYIPENTALLPEQPLLLINEPTLQLYYAQDVEFERPQTTIKFRFVTSRDHASAEMDLLLRFYEMCLEDAIEPAAGAASIAGVDYSLNVGLEGIVLTVSGFGESPLRFARYVADQMLTFEISPERFASLSELVQRRLQSYAQTEAYNLARDRNTALFRETHFLPDHSLDQAANVTWSDVKAAAKEFFSAGKIQTLVHGHISPAEARKAARNLNRTLRPSAVSDENLLSRRHIAMAPGQTITDVAAIEGVNSTYRAVYRLPDESPETRAAASVIGNFIRTPYFEELRTKQQLGYIVGSGDGASLRERVILFVIQSSEYSVDEQRARSEAFINELPDMLASLPAADWQTLIEGVRSQLEEKPKSIAEKANKFFTLGYDFDGEWSRTQDVLAALDKLDQATVAKMLAETIDPAKARSFITLLSSSNHEASTATPSFTDRESWKAQQRFE